MPDITPIDFQGFGSNYTRPKWIGINRTEQALGRTVINSIKDDKNFGKMASALSNTNSLAYWKEIFSKNMNTLNGPQNLMEWQKKFALVLQKFLQLLMLKAKYLSQKGLRKELKKLKAEFLAIQARHISEEEKIKALNAMLEAERQAYQPLQTVENAPKPKEIKPIEGGFRLSKKLLRKLLAKLGLELGANSQDIQKAYEALAEDKQTNPANYSEQAWAEIEEAYEILSGLDDHELAIIAESNDQLTPTEANHFLETLGLDPNEPHTVKEIDQAFFVFSLNNALNAENPDTGMQKLYQTFVNHTEGIQPHQLTNLHQLAQEVTREQTFAPTL